MSGVPEGGKHEAELVGVKALAAREILVPRKRVLLFVVLALTNNNISYVLGDIVSSSISIGGNNSRERSSYQTSHRASDLCGSCGNDNAHWVGERPVVDKYHSTPSTNRYTPLAIRALSELNIQVVGVEVSTRNVYKGCPVSI